MAEKLRLLILCTGNSCRSQMAEGWVRHLHGDAITVASAGTEPRDAVDPRAVRAMAEAGVDIAGHRPKRTDDPEIADATFDVAVTVCGDAREACPTVPNARRTVHVGFDDPPRLARLSRTDREAMAHYRRVRDEVRAFAEAMPASLEPRAPERPRVLFLCTGNTARSQMAEALLRHHAPGRFVASSAGFCPKEAVHPMTLRVLAEAGVDAAGLHPKPSGMFMAKVPVAVAITVCDAEAAERDGCPRVFPFVGRHLQWPFPDPAAVEGSEAERLAAFRRVRDAVDARLRDWLRTGAAS